MFRPTPMPAAATAAGNANPAEELDTSCLNCFSRRTGLIAIAWIIVVMNVFGLFSSVELMTATRAGALAIIIIYFLIQLGDLVITSLLLLGIRDGVVRTRINIWIIWNIGYSAVLLVLFIIFVVAVTGVSAVEGILGGIRLILLIVLRLYGCYAGWKFREDIMSAPPAAAQVRPETFNPESGSGSGANPSAPGSQPPPPQYFYGREL